VTAASADDGWRRLSRRMLLIHPIQELPRALPAFIGLLAAGRSSGNGELWAAGGVAVAIALGLVRWFTTTYRVTEDRVEVSEGLLRRRLLAISRDRVRSVDVTSHALHRVLGLTRVTVGTGRSDHESGGRVRLDGLTEDETGWLRDELLRREAPADTTATGTTATGTTATDAGATGRTATDAGATGRTATGDPDEIELARLDSRWVRYAPFTLSGVVAVGAAVGFLANAADQAHVQTRDLGPVRHLTDQLERAQVALVVVVIAVIVLAAVVVASTFGYVLAFWNFRLARRPSGTLHVTRGLITTRATTIEERRLHGVEISEPLLLRLVGGARCVAIATGLRAGRGAERSGSLLLPPAPRREAERVGAAIGKSEVPVRCPVDEHGASARRRRYTRALGGWALLALAVAAVSVLAGWPGWPWQVALGLGPVAVGLAADRYRSLGHAVAAASLVARGGSLIRRRDVLSADGIIGWNVERSLLQRRSGLATLTATTAAGRQHYDVQDVEIGEALRVAAKLLPGLLEPFLECRAPIRSSPGGPVQDVAGATRAARSATGP
jgi:putative membrane protein